MGELTAALTNVDIDRLILKSGTYKPTAGFTPAVGCPSSMLCITRNVTMEAEEAGTVVLDASRVGRVIEVMSGAELKLIGMDITGGYAGQARGATPSCHKRPTECDSAISF